MKLTLSGSLFLCLLLLMLGGTRAYTLSTTAISGGVEANIDSIKILPVRRLADSVWWMRRGESTCSFKQESNKSGDFFLHFNEIDTSYIKPQRYNFAPMLQNTNTHKVYRLSSSNKQSITLTPEATVRIGSHFGWHWIFLGYTLDVKHLDFWNKNNSLRQECDLSLYSSMFGLDIYCRKIGNDYKIKQLYLGKDISTDATRSTDFGELASTIKDFNLHHIFNHHRFSYPAAFSQSTIQHRSAGDSLLGIGYTQHSLGVSQGELNRVIPSRLGSQVPANPIDSILMFSEIKYTDISVGGGYAYNWVFIRNWVLAGSLSLVLAYKGSKGDVTQCTFSINDSKFSNINVNGIGRSGVAWSNSKWYVGMNTILHTHNYHRSNFSTNSFLGSINLCVDFNFGRKKEK